MSRITYIALVFVVLITFVILAADEISFESSTEISDSLKQTMENRLKRELGITDYSTLVQTSNLLNININELKRNLGLDVKNNRLDNMQLKQLGVSVYQVSLAQESIEFGFNTSSSLTNISNKYNIPIKRLKYLLNLNPLDHSLNNRSIQSLEISPDSVRQVIDEFQETIYMVGSNIIMIGMLVVFLSLFITSFVIMQLKHLNILTQEKPAKSLVKVESKGKILSIHPATDNCNIAAVIAILNLHRYQIEERRKLSLTFQRERSNYWRGSAIISMPNRNFPK